VEHETGAGPSATDRSKQFLTALALVRLAAGGASLVRPEVLARVLGVDSASARRTGFVAQMFAGREIAIGVGGLYAAYRGGPAVRPWLAAALFSDAVDAVALVGAARNQGLAPVRTYGVAAGAVASVAGAAVTLWTLRNLGKRST
jgi:hypothetical protein